MAEEVQLGGPPKDKPKKPGKPDEMFGMPTWMAVSGGTVVVVVAYLMWRKHQLAAAAGSGQAAGQQTGQTNYAAGLANEQTSSLYAQLLNLQQQVGNLSPQAQAQQWQSWEAGTETLNDMAAISSTTPDAIISNTLAQAGGAGNLDKILSKYFDAGNYDDPLPLGAVLSVPIFSKSDAPPAVGTGNKPIGSVNPGDVG